jgi:hypothetical protein
MAKGKSGDTERVDLLGTVRLLVEAAKVDTAFRDLYLPRASELLAQSLTREEYDRLKRQPAEIDDLLRQTQEAVGRQDWVRVLELSRRVAGLRGTAQARQSELQLADEVYGAVDVLLDPFSPGFGALLGHTSEAKAALRNRTAAALTALEKSDPAWGSLYSHRRSHLEGLSLSATAGAAGKGPARDQTAELQEQALRAAERGDVNELQKLAQAMLKASSTGKAAAPSGAGEPGAGAQSAQTGRRSLPRTLGEPFPPPAIERAGSLGLAHVQATIPSPELADMAAQTFDRYGWRPSFPTSELAKEGEMHLRAGLEGAQIPRDVVEPLLEVTSFFAMYPFVNGSGVRYCPLFPESEFVLVEDFSEDAVPAKASELLAALGLTRRNGLSRAEIEVALRERGAGLLKERLGLDPVAFRLVCIPYDLYVRIGQGRGWGQQSMWTHVDGYQMLKGGSRLRALVAGNVRFGGLFDLCSISSTDAREGVVARLAVVHRERLLAR